MHGGERVYSACGRSRACLSCAWCTALPMSRSRAVPSDFGCGESSSRERCERPIAFALTSLQDRSARPDLLCHWSERASLRGAGGYAVRLFSVLCPGCCARGGPHVRANTPANVIVHHSRLCGTTGRLRLPSAPAFHRPFLAVSQNPLSGDLIELEVFGVSKSASPLGRPNEKRCAPAASRRARRLQGLAHEVGKRACRMHR